jgi:uncharacterized protein (TIGR03000 family)
MVRHWFSLCAVLAVATLMVTSDASQARERRLFRRWRGDNAFMTSTQTTETVMVRERRLGRRFRTYSYAEESMVSSVPTYGPVVRERRLGRRFRSYPEPIVTAPPQMEARRSLYEPPAQPTPAYLTLRVPAQAEISFDGEKTMQKGALRRYISPPVNPSGMYTYEIKAKWMQDGQERVVTRNVDVRAGEQLQVDLTRPVTK